MFFLDYLTQKYWYSSKSYLKPLQVFQRSPNTNKSQPDCFTFFILASKLICYKPSKQCHCITKHLMSKVQSLIDEINMFLGLFAKASHLKTLKFRKPQLEGKRWVRLQNHNNKNTCCSFFLDNTTIIFWNLFKNTLVHVVGLFLSLEYVHSSLDKSGPIFTNKTPKCL